MGDKQDPSLINWQFQDQVKDEVWYYPPCVRELLGESYVGDENAFLYGRVAACGPGNYANLGDFLGATAVGFGWALRDLGYKGKVYTVDLWNQEMHFSTRFSRKRFSCASEGVFYWSGLRCPLKPDDGWIYMCRGRTDEWGERLKRGKNTFRAIFIDADHSYEACKNDFEVWSPMLERDGELIFHDCHCEGVDRTIRELGPEWKQTFHVLTTKVFKRA